MRHLGFVTSTLLAASLMATGCNTSSPQSAPNTPPTSGLYNWLVSEAVPVPAPLAVDVSALPTENPNDRRETVGVTTTLGASIDLSSARAADLSATPRNLAGGAIRADGSGFVWSAVVASPGAWALRLQLTDVYLPRNTELYVYSDHREVAGPYTDRGVRGSGQLWTGALRGDRVHLQIRYSGADTDRALDALRFDIAEVGVLDDRFPLLHYGHKNTEKSFCSFNETCVHNAECSNIPAAVQQARTAVGEMLFASGGFLYICTGGLVADSAGTGTPYFLTANHCISKGREADSLETYFFYEESCGSTSCDFPTTAHTVGSSIVASNRTGDYTLLQLDQPAPAGATFLPTNHNPVAFTNGASLYRVSHPGGAPQAYSEHSVDSNVGTCSSWPRGSWIYSRDTYGATEGGSSGSPVLNAAGEVVGQLSGGCGFNVNDVCDNTSNATVDGALASYWDDVAPFLDNGGGTCTDADSDGFCAETDDCNDSDGSVNPSALEVCDDGVDNDCDGDTDAADGDCSSGGCDLLPAGASCTASDQCCSNNCKGGPGNKTCK